MFDEILQMIETSGKSVHACRNAARFARGKTVATCQDAAAYLLLALEAEQFFELNERMPMRTNDVEQAFGRMRAHVGRPSTWSPLRLLFARAHTMTPEPEPLNGCLRRRQ